MAGDPNPDKLRQMAEHRGLKLLKSRRRKPGTGDYGKFGLTDAAGKPLLGVGDDGLTASAAEIADWLRAGTLGTWQESASTVPDRPAVRPNTPPPIAPEPAEPVKPKSHAKPDRPKPPSARKPAPAPTPLPVLAIRPATPDDADAIAKLLSRLNGITIDSATTRRNLAATAKAGGGIFIAEFGKPIGCCGWAIVHTIHRGPIGRITAVFVDPDHRRQGIARKMLAAAEAALTTAGCTLVEAISDIQVDNAHNFFRALKFEQASYRFVRKPGN